MVVTGVPHHHHHRHPWKGSSHLASPSPPGSGGQRWESRGTVDTGVAAPGPGQVESRGQKGQEHGCPQEGGHDKARVPSAQLKCSFIKRLPKKGLPARKGHPWRVGGTRMDVVPKCPQPSPESTSSQVSSPSSGVPILPQHPPTIRYPPEVSLSIVPITVLIPTDHSHFFCPHPSQPSTSFLSVLVPPRPPLAPSSVLIPPKPPCPSLMSLSPL